MSYISRDEQLLLKIVKYMEKMRVLYARIEDLSADEIEDGMDGMALAQCATNLFELATRITNDELSDKLFVLSSGRLAKLRNIASHDYDAIDWTLAKKICARVIDTVLPSLLEECMNNLKNAKQQTKDYTNGGEA